MISHLTHRTCAAIGFAVLLACQPPQACAADGVWNVKSGGSWSNPNNWLNGVVPSNTGDSATFTLATSEVATAVTLDQNATLGILNISSLDYGYSYYITAINPSTVLYFDNGTASSVINDIEGYNTISANIQANADLTLNSNLPVSSELTISGSIIGTGNLSVTGMGTVRLTNDDSFAATSIAAGAFLAVGQGGTTGSLGSGPLAINGILSISRSDSVTLSNPLSGAGTLTLGGGGTFTLTSANGLIGSMTSNLTTPTRLGADNALAAR